MATQKLYFQNPYQTEFMARVVGVEKIEERVGIILDRTAFYPTGGGQPHDTGFLGEYPVLDVIERDDGEVIHLIEGNYQGETAFYGKIDWDRRFDHMQQHSAQHILSAVLKRAYGIETVAFHLGNEFVSIDVATTDMIPIEEVEDLVNQIILKNMPIETEFVSRDELESELIRKVPNEDQFVRIVEIPEIDINACCGTHPSYTAEVGMLKIVDTELHRGNRRIYFIAGWRALRKYQQTHRMIQNMSGYLKTNDKEIEDRLLILKNENEQLKKEIRSIKQELIQRESQDWKHKYVNLGEYHFRMHCFLDRPFQELKELAKTIIEDPNEIVLFATKRPKAQVIAACSQNVTLSMLELIEYMAPRIDGKGGGSRVFAQIGGEETHLDETLKSLMSWLKQLHDSK